MNMKISHRPPHYRINDKIYFVTARTIVGVDIFNSNTKKNILRRAIKTSGEKYGIKVYAWVILDNHYHLLFNIPNGDNLPSYVGEIHGKSSIIVNKLDNTAGKKIWSNYWDTCIRNESDFWKRFNYIHQNPVKHKHCKEMKQYLFSSLGVWIERKGVEWINDLFEKYIIIDFTPKGDI